MENSKTIIIACGGTGGHLYPGIALAREIKKRGFIPLFIVKENDLSCRILDLEKIPYRQIPVIGLPRHLSFKQIKFMFLFIKAFFKAVKIMKEVKPSKVVGMGGYISSPTIMAAWFRGVKVILHEQNLLPGLANRVLKGFADKIAISFQESSKFFSETKTVFTGNPVRLEVFEDLSSEVYEKYGLLKDKFTVLLFGGSQGAKNLNKNLTDSLQFLKDVKQNLQFVHLTGSNDLVAVRTEYEKNGFRACVLPYLETIGEAYYMADFIISRSGASTVSELEILNKTALLIPFPYATENHQEYNAKALAEKLKAVMLKEKDLRPDILAAAILFQLKTFRSHRYKVELPSPLPQEKLADLVLV